jgi:hypothetical protein
MTGKPLIEPDAERRQFKRFRVAFKAKLFARSESETDCELVDLSAGGAAIRCSETLVLGETLVLYIDGFGRYDAVCARFADGAAGLRFVCGDAKRKRLIEKLNRYVADGATDVSTLRASERVSSTGDLNFTRANGEVVKCEVIDISLHGVSLRTNSRPPIAEILQVGRTCGRVVRHHEHGIAIEFLRASTERQKPQR